MRFLKKTVYIFSFLLLLSIAGLWIFSHTINPETIKTVVAERIQAVTHKPTTIKGELAWRIFPRPGIRMGDLSIGVGKEGDYSVKAQRLLFNLELTPLLHGRLVFGEVAIDNFQIAVNPDDKAAKPPVTSQSRSARPSPSSGAGRIAVQRVRLTNGKIAIRQAAGELVFDKLQLDASRLNLAGGEFPFKVKTRFKLLDQDTVVKGNLRYDGKLQLPQDGMENGKLLADIYSRGQLAMQDVQVQNLPVRQISAGVLLKNHRLALDPIRLELLDGSATGKLSLNLQNYHFHLKQTLNSLDAQQLLAALQKKPAVSGLMDGTVNLEGTIGSKLLPSLDGKGALSLLNGGLIGMDIPRMLTSLQAKADTILENGRFRPEDIRILSELEAHGYGKGDTSFQVAVFPFSLKQGRLFVSGLRIDNESFNIAGSLNANLINQKLHGPLAVTFASDTNGGRLLKLQDKLGGQFPLRVAGSLQKVMVTPDPDYLQKKFVGTILKKSVGKMLNKVFR